MSYANSPPKYMTTLISKTTPHFYHEWQRVSHWEAVIPSSASTLRASTIILISINTTRAIIITLFLWNMWRWRWRSDETIYDNLSSCDTTNTGVHLTQLITESVKASIHVHKLCHDGLESHSTHRRRKSGGGWSGRSLRSHRLGSWLLRSKLGLAPSNSCCVYGTHDREMWRLRIGDRHMAKNPHDSWREYELITGRRILIDIYKREYKVREKIYGKPLKER